MPVCSYRERKTLFSVVKGKMFEFYEEVKRLLKTLSDFNLI